MFHSILKISGVLCNKWLTWRRDDLSWINKHVLIENTVFILSRTGEAVIIHFQFSSVQSLSRVWLYVTPWTTAARPPCPSPTPGGHPNPSPSSQWYHPTILSSVGPFSSCPQSLPASESFPMSQLFAWGSQSTGVSAFVSFLPKKSQGWSPSEWAGWISLQSKGLSRVFSNTTIQKHQFFST